MSSPAGVKVLMSWHSSVVQTLITLFGQSENVYKFKELRKRGRNASVLI